MRMQCQREQRIENSTQIRTCSPPIFLSCFSSGTSSRLVGLRQVNVCAIALLITIPNRYCRCHGGSTPKASRRAGSVGEMASVGDAKNRSGTPVSSLLSPPAVCYPARFASGRLPRPEPLTFESFRTCRALPERGRSGSRSHATSRPPPLPAALPQGT